MPKIVLTEAEIAMEQSFLDEATNNGLKVIEVDPPQGNVDMLFNELSSQLGEDDVKKFIDEFKAKKWFASEGDKELGAYPDKFQLARAYCRKKSLKGYPEHLDEKAQWQKDQVDTVGLDLVAEKAKQDAAPLDTSATATTNASPE